MGSGNVLSALGPDPRALLLFGASGAYPVFGFHRWWTVLSAAWLHAGLLHILFNMMSVRQLGPPTVDFYGPARTFIIYIAGAIVGFTLSSVAGEYFPGILRGGQLTVGASASICGLIGALLYYGHRTGSAIVRSESTRFIIMLAIYGFIMPGIDNWAHAGGVGGGYLAAMVLDPLKAERGDHVLIAVVLAVLSIASIVVSVVTAS
jgi:rhomboid protease GluP